MVEKEKDKKKKKVDDKKMSFIDHLEEMRWVLIKCIASIIIFTIASFIFSERLITFITAPYPGEPLITLSPMEPFTIRLNISVIMGIIISLPVIIYQLWSFAAPGLLKKEKKFAPFFIFLTILCFLIGAVFCYYMIIPNALKFFAKYQLDNVVMMTSYNRYLSFSIRLLVVFGLAFELPIISALLAKIGILTPNVMKTARGYAIVFIFAGAAILTPPDLISQIFLAIPIIILYEISIFITKIFAKKRERELEEALDDEYEYRYEEKKKSYKVASYGLLTLSVIIVIILAVIALSRLSLVSLQMAWIDFLLIPWKIIIPAGVLTVILFFVAVYMVKDSKKKIPIKIKKKLSRKTRKISKTAEKVKEERIKDKKPEEKKKDVEKKKESKEAAAVKKEEHIEKYEDQYDEYGYEEYDYRPEEYTKTAVSEIYRPRKILRWTGVMKRRPRRIWWKKRLVWWKGRMIRIER